MSHSVRSRPHPCTRLGNVLLSLWGTRRDLRHQWPLAGDTSRLSALPPESRRAVSGRELRPAGPASLVPQSRPIRERARLARGTEMTRQEHKQESLDRELVLRAQRGQLEVDLSHVAELINTELAEWALSAGQPSRPWDRDWTSVRRTARTRHVWPGISQPTRTRSMRLSSRRDSRTATTISPERLPPASRSSCSSRAITAAADSVVGRGPAVLLSRLMLHRMTSTSSRGTEGPPTHRSRSGPSAPSSEMGGGGPRAPSSSHPPVQKSRQDRSAGGSCRACPTVSKKRGRPGLRGCGPRRRSPWASRGEAIRGSAGPSPVPSC